MPHEIAPLFRFPSSPPGHRSVTLAKRTSIWAICGLPSAFAPNANSNECRWISLRLPPPFIAPFPARRDPPLSQIELHNGQTRHRLAPREHARQNELAPGQASAPFLPLRRSVRGAGTPPLFRKRTSKWAICQRICCLRAQTPASDQSRATSLRCPLATGARSKPRARGMPGPDPSHARCADRPAHTPDPSLSPRKTPPALRHVAPTQTDLRNIPQRLRSPLPRIRSRGRTCPSRSAHVRCASQLVPPISPHRPFRAHPLPAGRHARHLLSAIRWPLATGNCPLATRSPKRTHRSPRPQPTTSHRARACRFHSLSRVRSPAKRTH